MNININNLNISYGKHIALRDINVSIQKGDLLAIVGSNGSGKSTLLNALAGIIKVNQGSIKGLNLNSVAYLPQKNQVDQTFPITLAEFVMMGLYDKIRWYQPICSLEKKKCETAIAQVGLQNLENSMISTLSGGQMQRALFARLLMQDKSVILLDEPFNAIDANTILDITEIIKYWHQDKRTIVMVLHDLEYVRTHCVKTLLLSRKVIGFGATQEVLIKKNIMRAQQTSKTFNDTEYWNKIICAA